MYSCAPARPASNFRSCSNTLHWKTVEGHPPVHYFPCTNKASRYFGFVGKVMGRISVHNWKILPITFPTNPKWFMNRLYDSRVCKPLAPYQGKAGTANRLLSGALLPLLSEWGSCHHCQHALARSTGAAMQSISRTQCHWMLSKSVVRCKRLWRSNRRNVHL